MKWNVKLFGDVADFRNGLNFICSDCGDIVKIIGVGDFQQRFRIEFDGLEHVQIAGHLTPNDLLQNHDLLFVRSNGNKALVGRCILIEGLKEKTSFSGFTIRARLKDSSLDPIFVGYFFQSGAAKRAINYAGGGTNISNLSQGILSEIEIPVPSLPHQRKIAKILSTWDDALEKLDALIAAKERGKKALAQEFFERQRHAKRDYIKTSEVFTNRSERNNQGAPILSVTQDQGVLRRDSLDRRIMADEANGVTYKLVYPGDFVISLRSFQGGLEYSPLFGAVSPAYHVITPRREIDHAYFRHYFKSYEFVGRLAVAVIGIRDGKQISFDDFAFMQIPFPHLDEQCRIARVLDTCDTEIRLLRDQRAAIDRQKRGLMQRLLTGRLRVKIPSK